MAAPRSDSSAVAAVSLSLSPHRGEWHVRPTRLASSVPWEGSPKCPRGMASLRRPGGGGALSAGAPGPVGTVRVVDGQRVGLGVEHPVFQGQHVIIREQKVEIPVWEGQVSGVRARGALGRGEEGLTSQHCPGGVGHLMASCFCPQEAHTLHPCSWNL